MAKNRQSKRQKDARKKRFQTVYSESLWLFKERYLTKKGKIKLMTAKTKEEKENIWKVYGKNRYILNPNAKPVKTIEHKIFR